MEHLYTCSLMLPMLMYVVCMVGKVGESVVVVVVVDVVVLHSSSLSSAAPVKTCPKLGVSTSAGMNT